MKITFVLPAIGKKPGQRYIGSWKMEPLAIAVLQALTPSGVQTELFDDRLELIDYRTDTDLVAIPVETYTAKRSYDIAARFRARGIPVVLGGYHVTLMPDEAAQHADAIVIGNAEPVWESVVQDVAAGRLKRRYEGNLAASDLQPDRSIFAGKRYLPVSLVETGRGCQHVCEFCAISGFYQRNYHARSVEAVIDDIRSSRHKLHFLVDDNLIADRDYAMRLFQAMKPLTITWASQGTLEMAKDPELLAAMRDAGCVMVLIGFESIEPISLKQMRKAWNQTLGEQLDLIGRIHAAGIGIYATFVVGYDGDSEDTIARTVDFAEEAGFFAGAFNHLLPFPGTPLHARLVAEDRLLDPKWWLSDSYTYGQLAFAPAQMTPNQVSVGCKRGRNRFHRPASVAARGRASVRRAGIGSLPLFLVMNATLGGEVGAKFDVPLGRNLDELPK